MAEKWPAPLGWAVAMAALLLLLQPGLVVRAEGPWFTPHPETRAGAIDSTEGLSRDRPRQRVQGICGSDVECPLGYGAMSPQTACASQTCLQQECCQVLYNWATLSITSSPSGVYSRNRHCSMTFGNVLLMVGGYPNGRHDITLNDVLRSTDGLTWTQSTTAAFSSPRTSMGCGVLGSRAYVVGGRDADGSQYYSEVYSTADPTGATWRLDVSGAFPGRSGHAAVPFLGKLWVISGARNGLRLNDVYSSEDPTQSSKWLLATSAAFDKGYADFVATVHRGQIWVMGGELQSQVYSSPNGTVWTSVTTTGRNPSFYGTVVSLKGLLWQLGDGRDVTVSMDGMQWSAFSQMMPYYLFDYGTGMVGANLLTIGGRSTSGGTFNQEYSLVANAAFPCLGFTCTEGTVYKSIAASSCTSGTCTQGDCCAELVDCGTPSAPANAATPSCSSGTTTGLKCTFGCLTGYAGGGKLTCTETRAWISTSSCTAVNCGAPGLPSNAKTLSCTSGTQYGQSC
eukprot:RCo023986